MFSYFELKQGPYQINAAACENLLRGTLTIAIANFLQSPNKIKYFMFTHLFLNFMCMSYMKMHEVSPGVNRICRLFLTLLVHHVNTSAI